MADARYSCCPTCGASKRMDAPACRNCAISLGIDTDMGYATPCWLWSGSISTSGYGRVSARNRSHQAHRVIYEALVGPIPDGLTIDHLCRVRACVRPDHLEPVTRKVNSLRGESPNARNARKTHCYRGHEFTPENTIMRGGGRTCRACKYAQTRAYRSLRANAA